MVVKIRLKRMGAKKQPKYRIIAIHGRDRRDGRPLEILGYYDPMKIEKTFLNREAISAWVKKGAQISPTVNSLFIKTDDEIKALAAKEKNVKKTEPVQIVAEEVKEEVVEEAAVEGTEEVKTDNSSESSN